MRIAGFSFRRNQLGIRDDGKREARLIAEPDVPRWSWRESNPRPNEEAICFLHAYLCIGFRATAGAELPTFAFSSKRLTVGARPPQAIPDFPAPPYRRASGRELPGDVSSQHLVPRLSQ